jgi:hypothetical protein
VNHPPSPLISQIVETVADVQRVGAKLLELVARMQRRPSPDALERQRQAQTPRVNRWRAAPPRLAAADRGEERDDLQNPRSGIPSARSSKRAGGIMPAHLRTPLERLELVGRFREQLADLLRLAAELEAADARRPSSRRFSTTEPPPVFLAAFRRRSRRSRASRPSSNRLHNLRRRRALARRRPRGRRRRRRAPLRPFGISAEISTETAAATKQRRRRAGGGTVNGAPALPAHRTALLAVRGRAVGVQAAQADRRLREGPASLTVDPRGQGAL